MDLDIVNHKSQEIKNFFSTLDELLECVEYVVKNNKPHLNGERFLDNRDVCELLHISSRTLQEYRDSGKIAFIKLEGKILYRQSDIERLLMGNYYEI